MPEAKKSSGYNQRSLDQIMAELAESRKPKPSAFDEAVAFVKARLAELQAKRETPVQQRAAKEGDKILRKPASPKAEDPGQLSRVLTREQKERAMAHLDPDQ